MIELLIAVYAFGMGALFVLAAAGHAFKKGGKDNFNALAIMVLSLIWPVTLLVVIARIMNDD